MQILEGLDGLVRLPAGAVVSIGNFDGVHRGHLKILEAAAALAEPEGRPLAVVTFEPHPLTVLRPEAAPRRLTSPKLKQELLERAGVDHLVVLPPAREVLDLSAEQFWEILRDRVRPAHLVEGSSFRFGKGAAGSIAKLRDWTSGSGIALHVVDSVTVPLLNLEIVPVSSSLIRWLLANGRARDAAICLGRAYAIEGKVVEGFRRGRELGIPTANLKEDGQATPADGVYAGRCEVDGRAYPAAISIGTLPTFNERVRQIEAHLVGFEGDLYGRMLRVELIDWLREQRKYPSAEPMMRQIQVDIAETVERARWDVAWAIAKE